MVSVLSGRFVAQGWPAAVAGSASPRPRVRECASRPRGALAMVVGRRRASTGSGDACRAEVVEAELLDDTSCRSVVPQVPLAKKKKKGGSHLPRLESRAKGHVREAIQFPTLMAALYRTSPPCLQRGRRQLPPGFIQVVCTRFRVPGSSARASTILTNPSISSAPIRNTVDNYRKTICVLAQPCWLVRTNQQNGPQRSSQHHVLGYQRRSSRMTGSTSPSAKPELKRHSPGEQGCSRANCHRVRVRIRMSQTGRMLAQAHRQSGTQPS